MLNNPCNMILRADGSQVPPVTCFKYEAERPYTLRRKPKKQCSRLSNTPSQITRNSQMHVLHSCASASARTPASAPQPPSCNPTHGCDRTAAPDPPLDTVRQHQVIVARLERRRMELQLLWLLEGPQRHPCLSQEATLCHLCHCHVLCYLKTL